MRKPRVDPRQRLSRNLAALMEMQKLSAPLIAARAKVDRKTINNLVRGRFDPRLTVVEKIANVFGMTTWQLLATDLVVRKLDSAQVVRLLEDYSNAKDSGREAIMNVAQIAAEGTGK
jgi:transcriptional regulator with XRE-family HTH domain